MRELPILFSAPMVRAILEGRKTVTRRVVKHQPDAHHWSRLPGYVGDFRHEGDSLWHFAHRIPQNPQWDLECQQRAPCSVGDRLWVRETFALEHDVGGVEPPHADGRPVLRRPDDDVDGLLPAWTQPHYRATDPAPDLCCERPGCALCRDHDMGPHWRPAIHMPRWASRIALEVTAVRVERLQDISEAQAHAEGIDGEALFRAQGWAPLAFERLWESINGAGSWADNPWVWVVEFRRIEKEVPHGG